MSSRRRMARDAVVALLVGLVVFVALYPASGQDSLPSKQWGLLGNLVPTPDPLLSFAAGGEMTIVVAVIIGVRRSDSSRSREL